MREKYEDIKIILCESTPHGDARDEEVLEINRITTRYTQDKTYIFLTKHSNLRTEDKRHFSDDKHVFTLPLTQKNRYVKHMELSNLMAEFKQL